MSSVKRYPRDVDLGDLDVSDPPRPMTPELEAACRAADERVGRFYRENPDASEIDRRLNDELHARVRQFRGEEG